ncbi:unnamed protein product [Lupinus luteus]|uniref:Uncharacterized protein n=1 Tax=Lupinus luteus TaxID=3873 RepID=A0AAV1W6U3_LUPLU
MESIEFVQRLPPHVFFTGIVESPSSPSQPIPFWFRFRIKGGHPSDYIDLDSELVFGPNFGQNDLLGRRIFRLGQESPLYPLNRVPPIISSWGKSGRHSLFCFVAPEAEAVTELLRPELAESSTKSEPPSVVRKKARRANPTAMMRVTEEPLRSMYARLRLSVRVARVVLLFYPLPPFLGPTDASPAQTHVPSRTRGLRASCVRLASLAAAKGLDVLPCYGSMRSEPGPNPVPCVRAASLLRIPKACFPPRSKMKVALMIKISGETAKKRFNMWEDPN